MNEECEDGDAIEDKTDTEMCSAAIDENNNMTIMTVFSKIRYKR